MKIKQNQSLNETNNINQMSTSTPIKTGDTTFVDGLKDLDMVNSMKETLDTKTNAEVLDNSQIENKEETSSKKIDDFCKSNIMYVAKNQDIKKEEKTNNKVLEENSEFEKTPLKGEIDNSNVKNEIKNINLHQKNKTEDIKQMPEKDFVKNENFITEKNVQNVQSRAEKSSLKGEIENTNVKTEKKVPLMAIEEFLPEEEISRKEPKATLEEFVILPEINNKVSDKNNEFSELEETLQTFNELPKISKKDNGLENNKIDFSVKHKNNKVISDKNININDEKHEKVKDFSVINKLSKEDLKNLIHSKKSEKISNEKILDNTKTLKNEVKFEKEINNFNELGFVEKKDFINNVMKADNRDFQPIQDKKVINNIINNIEKTLDKAETNKKSLTINDVQNIVNNVIKKDNSKNLQEVDNLVLNDTKKENVVDFSDKKEKDDVKLSVEDFKPEVVKEQLKPQIETLDAIKEQFKNNGLVEENLQTKDSDNKLAFAKNQPIKEDVKPVVDNVKNYVQQPKINQALNPAKKENLSIQPKAENVSIKNETINIQPKTEEVFVKNEALNIQPKAENVSIKKEAMDIQPKTEKISAKNETKIADAKIDNKTIIAQPKVEKSSIESDLLNQILNEEVDLTKQIPVMEEVVPEQLRKPIQKPEQKAKNMVETPVQPQLERTAIEPEKKQPLEDLSKFLSEIMSEDTVEDLKSKDVSMIDDNTLLTEEIKNYYNLNKAQNLNVTEDVKNVINERIAEINDLSAIVETAQEAKSIQKDLKSLDVQKIQSKKVETKSLKMTEQDANFFIELVKNNQDSNQTVADSTKQILQDVQQMTDDVQQTTRVSKALADMIGEATKTNKPFRIDFDKNISVIIKIDREGKISAEFLPGDKAVEQYLRTQLPILRQKFNDENIDYKDLNYRQSNGGRQNRERRKRGE